MTTHRKPRAHEPDSERRKIEKENLTVTVDLSKPSGVRPSVSIHQNSTGDHCVCLQVCFTKKVMNVFSKLTEWFMLFWKFWQFSGQMITSAKATGYLLYISLYTVYLSRRFRSTLRHAELRLIARFKIPLKAQCPTAE